MVADSKSKSDLSFSKTFASSAFSACFAEVCTIPLDTAKVRLKLQKQAVAGDVVSLPKYKGMLGTVATIAREEGLSALWKGIVPGLHHQCLYAGKTLYVGKDRVGDVPLSKKIAAFTTGVQALWTGLGPNIARNAIINAAELASCDQVKQTILKIPGFTDNVVTHLLAGLGAGFFAVCIGSPVDKSRMMGDSSYKSTLDCFIKTLKNDGPFAFYKGFLPNFGQLGSWNVIMFLTLEQV
uniref:Mitochondrial uncoupling protein 1 n=1 Tax=Cajanus cajan TaxID=3821 RepID=A0A151TKV9_CAJCA|nr:hypothetical protein KK1_024044 [Cajanus cajan]